MSHRFTYTPSAGETEFRLVGPQGAIPTDEWAIGAPDGLVAGINLLRRLEAANAAVVGDDVFLVDNGAVAGLTAREGTALGLPPLPSAAAHVVIRGTMSRPDFGIDLEWCRPTGQPVLGARRVGAFLRIGENWWRLPAVLHQVAEAIDGVNSAGEDDSRRYTALAILREALPVAELEGVARAQGLAANLKITVADAFSLDLEGDGAEAKLVPILHRAGADSDDPILPPDLQQAFGRKHFHAFGAARAIYALGGGAYVVLAPVLRRALDVVRQTQAGSLAAKRALMASPRSVLREALGDDVDDTVLDSVFRETAAYSERVKGLGLWEKRVLPWVMLSGIEWLHGAPVDGEGTKPADQGLVIGDKKVSLSLDEVRQLQTLVENALGKGKNSVSFTTSRGTVEVPANYETLGALQRLESVLLSPQGGPPKQPSPEPPPGPEVLLIDTNECAVDIEGAFKPRPMHGELLPSVLATALKPHQEEGLSWLRKAYAMGRPGVLLADDMGLGKTIQALAFLAWVREGMDAGKVKRAPVAVVAPTGLLQNWQEEAARHLHGAGLGRCIEAYGKGLAALKRPGPDGRPSLEQGAIAGADWVLTTYETLRDYDCDFGAIPFAVMVFDEAQKIKMPGIRLTDAAKAMQADFRVALTGTPVENRLADLWCITDTIHPAFLGDLKSFSADYERNPEPDRLRLLKKTLDTAHGGRAPILLRRLKVDRLPDVPAPDERKLERAMPPPQRDAYAAALAAARGGQKDRGAILKALQTLRAVSLHPNAEMDGDDATFINASARCQLLIEILDGIAAKSEKALIFVDALDFQARLAGVLQRRYELTAPPSIINGSVAGHLRQVRVNRFQSDATGFDVMILSPRAGGVGVTLTAANHAIHLARWWNPAVEDQCTGRVLRIGQRKPVFVHLPLAVLGDDHQSFDQNLDTLIRRKRQLFQDAFMPPEATDGDRDELFRETVG